MRKKVTILIMLLSVVVGCATTIKPTYVDPTGRQMPVPHYVLQSTSTKIQAMFYYTLWNGKKDLDGTLIETPTYLPMKPQEIQFQKNKLLALTIEILNPNKSEYVLWATYEVVYENNSKSLHGQKLAMSNLNYRAHSIALPYSSTIKVVDYKVEILCKGQPVILIGNFHYVLTK